MSIPVRNLCFACLLIGLGMKDAHGQPFQSQVEITVTVYRAPPFEPVAPTGISQPVFFDDVAVACESLESGDEIGIFDGSLCVGMWVVDSFPAVEPATVYLEATIGESVLPGAQPGNEMIFVAWDASSDTKISLSVTQVLQGPNPPVFQAAQTVVLALSDDDTAPEITQCAANPGPLSLDGDCEVALPDLTGDVVATDNCGTPVITQTPAAGTAISADTLVTLTATDGAGLTDTCQVTVTVGETLTLLAPIGANTWAPGTTETIAWDSEGGAGTHVNLKLRKGGELHSWIRSQEVNDGEYEWMLPCELPEGNDYQIEIYCVEKKCLSDLSEYFTIASPVCLESPNGGEEWVAGSTQLITWETGCFGGPQDLVKLKLFKGCSFHSWISGPTWNDGQFLWRIPCELEAGADYRVQIYSASNFSLVDFSDADFSIIQPACLVAPNGGEEWMVNTQQVITWDPSYFGSPGQQVKLKLFQGCRFHSWISGSTPNDGSFSWRVPCNLEAGADYRVQIYSASDFSLMDFSDTDFSILQPACLVAPNGGEEWMVNTQQVITWDPSYFGSPGQQVKLKLFQGCRFHSWISGPTDNDGNFLWRVPCDLEAGDDYQIQIYSVSDFSLMDFSDADFTILQPTCLVWPEWGVEWVAGSQETILWEPDCFGSSEERVKLKLFKNCRFHSWISGPTPNDGEFLWRVPCETEPGSSYRIQIYAESDFSLMDFSDGDLAIVSPACLATPNGGEEWMVNTQQVITWDPVYFGSPAQQVKLKLFKGCRFHSWISGPTNNDGTFWWRVPCDLEAGDDYRIQIYSASDFSFQDFSDGDFTVLQPTCLTVPDGGEQWVIGSRPRISWNPVCFGDQDDFVKLKLFQGCGFYGWISGSTPNDGTFDWTVPGNVAPSWDYRVQIYSVSDFSIMDFSDGDFGILAGK